MKKLRLLRKIWSVAMIFFIISTAIVPAFGNTLYPDGTVNCPSSLKTILVHLVEKQKEFKLNALYLSAVEDSKTIEPEEILPVVSIAQDSHEVTWNKTGDKVLLLTWHKYPDSYVDGAIANLKWGEVWTFTPKEMKEWIIENGSAPSSLRLEQLLGLPANKGYTHVSALWVSPADVLRPAYTSNIYDGNMTDKFLTQPDDEYFNWFNGNMTWSYEDSAFPWTRLGYTYDWADNGTEYGLSEFIIKKGSVVEVEYTLTTEEFLKSIAK